MKIVMLMLSVMSMYMGIKGQESKVNLTAENGIRLVGSNCPGTAKLFCEGVDISVLRWSYNGNNQIETFLPDVMATTLIPLNQNPAFLTVELKRVSQNVDRPLFGNFSSILTVNLSQLEEQNVTDISCGDSGTLHTLNVDIHIIPHTVPEDPQIVKLVATRIATNNISITVSWIPLVAECSGYNNMVYYMITISGRITLNKQVNGSTCSQTVCVATFNIPTTGSHNIYTISLQASNSIGVSNPVTQSVVLVNGNMSGSSLVKGVIITLLVSFTLGVIIGLSTYHFIIKKLINRCELKRQQLMTQSRQTPNHALQSNIVYAEPRTSTEHKQVELKANESYGQGQNRIRQSQQEEDIEHSYEFVGQ